MVAQPITPRQAQEWIREGRGRLIDVRTPLEFAEVHAEGAELRPLDRLDPLALDAERSGRALYLICKSGQRSADALQRCREAGLEDLHVVAGGTEAWEAAGLPVERRRVISLERQVRIGAGALVVSGVLLGWLVHPALHGIAAFVGAGLLFAGLSHWCGMAQLLARAPWNRGVGGTCSR